MMRRLVAVVLAGALGLGGLTACRVADIGSAAYVGDTRYTQHQVTDVANAYQRARVAAGAPQVNQLAAERLMLGYLIFLDVAKRYTEEKHLPKPELDYAGAAQQSGLPATDPYLRTAVAALSYGQPLVQQARPRTPTEADIRAVYQTLVDQGYTESYEVAKPQIQALGNLSPALGARDELAGAARRYGVDINPRYGSVQYTLLSVNTSNNLLSLVDLPLSTPPVVDAQ